MKPLDAAYILLPLVLWPLVFLVFSSYFVYAMAIATFILAMFTLWRHGRLVIWKKRSISSAIIVGVAGAVILYLIFLAGYYLAVSAGLLQYVQLVYSTIYSQASRIVIFILLALIGIFEEIYWRGGLQEYISKHLKRFKNSPWIVSTLYYTAVHLSTLNPILVIAAFFVGLVTSLTANRYGITSSITAHVIWIEAIIVFIPVIPIH